MTRMGSGERESLGAGTPLEGPSDDWRRLVQRAAHRTDLAGLVGAACQNDAHGWGWSPSWPTSSRRGRR